METEKMQMDLDMPQLRRMVLENTERIDRNEMKINLMSMENNGQNKSLGDFDLRMKSFHEEFEESMRRSAERMDRLERFAEQSRLEQEKRSRELDARFAQADRQREESRKAVDRQLKETSLEVKRLARQLTGTTGHIVEGLVSSSTEKIFGKAGLKLHNSGKNLKRNLPSEHIAMEVDVLLSNEEMAVPVEVKTNCTKEDIHHFLHQMERFRRLFPEYDGRGVFAAIAAVKYEKGVAVWSRPFSMGNGECCVRHGSA